MRNPGFGHASPVTALAIHGDRIDGGAGRLRACAKIGETSVVNASLSVRLASRASLSCRSSDSRSRAVSRIQKAGGNLDYVTMDDGPPVEPISPWNRHVFPARECPCRAVRAKERNAYRLAGALFDSLGARISVEVRLGEAPARRR